MHKESVSRVHQNHTCAAVPSASLILISHFFPGLLPVSQTGNKARDVGVQTYWYKSHVRWMVWGGLNGSTGRLTFCLHNLLCSGPTALQTLQVLKGNFTRKPMLTCFWGPGGLWEHHEVGSVMREDAEWQLWCNNYLASNGRKLTIMVWQLYGNNPKE